MILSHRITNRVAKPINMMVLSAIVLTGTAGAADGLEQRRVSQNANNLAKMAPSMRPKVAAIIRDMEGAGYKPIIDNAVYRTPAEQLALYRKGYSKVTYSYHNCTSPTGKPDSLAADIIDQRWGWTGVAPRRYWVTQARAAWVHDVYAGSHFGLTSAQKKTFDRALESGDLSYSGPLGWDPSHCEPRGITLGEAKKGKRPYGK